MEPGYDLAPQANSMPSFVITKYIYIYIYGASVDAMAPHFHNTFAGILTAEISVLDDISRAPGEALNVLLRILNERKFGNDEIPLVTAIATANPSGDQ